jgi:hypothetical protein
MHTPEEESKHRDGMRKYLSHEAETNPINLDIVEDVGAAPTRKAGAAWLNRQEVLGVLPCIGTMKGRDGRTNLKVHCRTNYKTDNLKHQIIGTQVRLMYPVFECEREPRDHACFSDMTLKNGDHVYEVEIECGTHKRISFTSRIKRHKCDRDILFVVSPKFGDPERRLKQVMEWSVAVADRAFFTTLDRLQKQGPHANVWDYLGRDDAPLKRVKLPVSEAVEKYAQNTAAMLEISQETDMSDDGD